MKKFILIFFMFSTLISYSQQVVTEIQRESIPQRQLNLIGELGGNGVFYSVGLEHTRFRNGVLKDSFRYGLSYTPSTMYGNCLCIFTELNSEFGKNKNYFEVGAGPTLLISYSPILIVTGRIGYRYNTNHFIFRAGFTPLFFIGIGSTPGFIPSAGISFGIPLSTH